MRKEQLLEWFNEENAERTISWLGAVENRTPVVLVGAGFTLNARNKTTNSRATVHDAPLWSHLVQRFSNEIGANQVYDAPVLFDLLVAEKGKAYLRDALRDALKDESLVPDGAHNALASYASEAIVTTNCLDTVLDKACVGDWRRVVLDQDLSASGKKRDLIYLHGHRDFADSWVMTRGQYEDLPRQKPVIVARTRQLLAQHPWLLVGFGMNDANIHAMIRLVSSEMQGYRPVSLAVVIGDVLASERKHWSSFGIEIVSPKSNSDLNRFFEWFFSKATLNHVPSADDVNRYVDAGVTGIERLRRFRALSQGAVPISERGRAYSRWRQVLIALLSPEERRATSEIASRARNVAARSRFGAVGSDAGVGLVEQPAASDDLQVRDAMLAQLPGGPFFSAGSSVIVRVLDVLLGNSKDLVDEVVAHFEWALEQSLFQSNHSDDDVPLAILTLRLLERYRGEDLSKLQRLARHALHLARKYGEQYVSQSIEAEFRRLNFAIPDEGALPVEQHLQEARAAFEAFMNAKFEEAASLYGVASQHALEAGRDLEAWAYSHGRASALVRRSVRAAEAWKEVQALASKISVDRWIKDADDRARSTLLSLSEAANERERFRQTGGQGRRFGGPAHGLWRAYRELADVYASPDLQRRYVEPLLELRDEGDPLLPLCFAKNPKQWIADLLLEHPVPQNRRVDRELRLINAALRSPRQVSRTEVLGGLDLVSAMRLCWRSVDLERATQWLRECSAVLADQNGESAWYTYSRLDEKLWSAFTSVAAFAPSPGSIVGLMEVLSAREHKYGARKALYALPWYRWAISRDVGARFLTIIRSVALFQDDEHGALPYMLFAILRMVDAGLDVNELKRDWGAVLDDLRECRLPQSTDGESRRAGFLLDVRIRGIVEIGKIFDAWFSFPTAEEDEDAWDAACDALRMKEDELIMAWLRKSVVALLNAVDAKESKSEHLTSHGIRLLGEAIVRFVDLRSRIRPVLLKLILASPESLPIVAHGLTPEVWGEDWASIVGLLSMMCFGAGGPRTNQDDPGAATRQQVAVLSVLTVLDYAALERSSAGAWATVRGFLIGAVGDDRGVVAQSAATAALHFAEFVENHDEAASYAFIIRQVVDDPRIVVRSVVADRALSLVNKARHELVRAAAEQALKVIALDENACLGALRAYAQSRASGSDV